MTFREHVPNYPAALQGVAVQPKRRPRTLLSPLILALCMVIPLCFGSCGQTATPPTVSSNSDVFSYFGAARLTTFDHAANQISVVAVALETGSSTPLTSGTFTMAPTGFLSITETAATTSSGGLTAMNPPLTGAWAVEIPGVGALANLLSVNNSNVTTVVSAAPAAMAASTACPNFSKPVTFLYVVMPGSQPATGTADFGTVAISNEVAAVTFQAQPFLIGQPPLPISTVTGGCSDTELGPLTAYPLNSFGSPASQDTIAIGSSGLLVDSFASNGNSSSTGAFGENGAEVGVIGVAMPSSQVNVMAVLAANYNGFLYAPGDSSGVFNSSTGTDDDGNPVLYDTTVMASAFGNFTASSPACSVLQSSITANLPGTGGTISAPPSASSLFGGEFNKSDPTGANGPARCDVILDLGQQDPQNNGLFPHAAIFIGQNYPPATDTSVSKNPCFFASTVTHNPCAFASPAAAIVGQVEGQFVIFAFTSLAKLPTDTAGGNNATPIGIYLFQKLH
jgi:hypothetical protein